MKNKRNIIMLIMLPLVLIGFSGCDDYLSVEPKSNWVVENFYQNKSDVELGLAGMYSYLGMDATYGQSLSAVLAAGTDEMLYNRTNTNWAEALYIGTAASTTVKDAWLNLYKGIDAANNFIDRVPGATGITEEERAQYLGEAHFLRALYYMDLVRFWGPVPLRVEPTRNVDANNIPASSVEEVYNQIIADLTFAAENLKHASELDTPGRASKMAAHGLLARAYITMAGEPLNKTEMYGKVVEQCNIIINDGWHRLNDSYKQVFLNYIQNEYDPKESMFEIEFGMLRDQGIREDGRIGQINGVQFYYWPTRTEPFAYALAQTAIGLVRSYDDENDQRKEWNVADWICKSDGSIDPIDNELLFWPGKFRRWEPITFGNIKDGSGSYRLLEDAASPDKNFTGINFPVLRYADVLLMMAEAENEVNGPGNAIAYLDQVRNRAGLDDIDAGLVGSKEAFRAEVRAERLRELCYEGHRKHDLIRWGILGETLALQNQMIDNASSSDRSKDNFKRAGLNFNPSKHTVLPYPLQEVTMNEALDQHASWE
ncbi:RagB/SusD family nutrient uptake outer membrane protein [Marinilabilia salmonicolor]|nr:RagB/SusD family nutrient uptake outer membrane protein [Marinilabilia salmonicolor]